MSTAVDSIALTQDRRFAAMVVERAGIIDVDRAATLQEALVAVSRPAFVESRYGSRAFDDCSLPIGFDQSSSTPSVILRMLSFFSLEAGSRFLEIGAGSGYVLALMHRIGLSVYGIELNGLLAQQTRKRLDRLGFSKVLLRSGSGFIGWQEQAPFNAILVSTVVSELPDALFEQLHPDGGTLVAPVGTASEQRLHVFQRDGERFESVRLERCQIR